MPDFSKLTLNDISHLLSNKKPDAKNADINEPEMDRKPNLIYSIGKLRTSENLMPSHSKSAFSHNVSRKGSALNEKILEASEEVSPSSSLSSPKGSKN